MFLLYEMQYQMHEPLLCTAGSAYCQLMYPSHHTTSLLANRSVQRGSKAGCTTLPTTCAHCICCAGVQVNWLIHDDLSAARQVSFITGGSTPHPTARALQSGPERSTSCKSTPT